MLGAAAAGGGGGVLVQGEVGSRNADVELGLWEGVCNKKRPACK